MWAAAIPLIASAVGSLFKHHNSGGGGSHDPVMGDGMPGDSVDPGGAGGGFSWGQAAPWLLGGAAGAMGGYLMGRHGGDSGGSGNAILDQLMALQLARSQQAEPLRQLLMNSAFTMLPTYMQQDPAGQAWSRNYGQSAQAAMTSPRRALVRS